MKKIKFLIFLLELISCSELAFATDYFTSCEIKEDKAYGVVAVPEHESLTVDGNIKFYLLNQKNQLLKIKRDNAYKYLYHKNKMVASVTVNDNIWRCYFDVSEAVNSTDKNLNSDLSKKYFTSCKIINGVSKGFVTVPGYDSITIDGYVKFFFYNINNEKMLKTKNDYEYEYIYHNTELVEEISAPDEANRCYFNISDAVK